MDLEVWNYFNRALGNIVDQYLLLLDIWNQL